MLMNNKHYHLLPSLILISALTACGGGSSGSSGSGGGGPDAGGSDGDGSAAEKITLLQTIDPGDECNNGGVKLSSGIDTNADGQLNDQEITETSLSCNEASQQAISIVIDESAGENCEFGGQKILIGIDDNSDQVLQDHKCLEVVLTM